MRDREAKSRPQAKHLRSVLTKAEAVLWTRLKRHDRQAEKFRRQHPIGPYIADFAHVRAKLVVELDGATHSTSAELAHDLKRSAYLFSRGWKVLRFANDDIYADVAGVVDAILSHVPPPVPSGPPPP